jgi:hypothetical protein
VLLASAFVLRMRPTFLPDASSLEAIGLAAEAAAAGNAVVPPLVEGWLVTAEGVLRGATSRVVKSFQRRLAELSPDLFGAAAAAASAEAASLTRAATETVTPTSLPLEVRLLQPSVHVLRL